jgi:hypothetical protein
MVEPVIKLSPVRLRNAYGVRVGSDLIPDVPNESNSLVHGELVDFVQKSLGCHGRNFAVG